MFFHFSEDPNIKLFKPRPSRLGEPVVWAISEEYSFLYHFPRDCPRIVIWAKNTSNPADRARWLGTARRAAYVETEWLDRINTAKLYRYALPPDGFVALDDVGMMICRDAVMPVGVDEVADLPAQLAPHDVALRSVPALAPVRRVWRSSLHASGIRLRNSSTWTDEL